MGMSETKCRRHPNHRQSPGVCSCCLIEKLSKLNTSPPSFNRLSSLSSSSPPSYSTGHRRNVSGGIVLNNKNSDGLKKSRSVSCANLSSRSKLRGINDNIINNNHNNNTKAAYVNDDEGCISMKKKNGFLKNLMNTSKKTKGVLMHSKTMKERSLSSTRNH
ncbi:hypothetical protein RND81_06G002000 [Saponaria officinalis]|uniref:Uncharacterized protein n=1 Tax=Saponaria officinalis TaxID=3572 RepID=A0AAW1K7R0_SAPOF